MGKKGVEYISALVVLPDFQMVERCYMTSDSQSEASCDSEKMKLLGLTEGLD